MISSPRPQWVITQTRLPWVPDATNSASSKPSIAATSSCRALTDGSSPKTSSPTSASAIAARMARVGLVMVSLRKSVAMAGAAEHAVLLRKANGNARPFRTRVCSTGPRRRDATTLYVKCIFLGGFPPEEKRVPRSVGQQRHIATRFAENLGRTGTIEGCSIWENGLIRVLVTGGAGY